MRDERNPTVEIIVKLIPFAILLGGLYIVVTWIDENIGIEKFFLYFFSYEIISTVFIFIGLKKHYKKNNVEKTPNVEDIFSLFLLREIFDENDSVIDIPRFRLISLCYVLPLFILLITIYIHVNGSGTAALIFLLVFIFVIIASIALFRRKITKNSQYDDYYQESDNDYYEESYENKKGGTVNSNLMKNYYNQLGISESHTNEEIKKAYRQLSKEYHPDKNKEKSAQMLFQNINKAYEAIKKFRKF